MENILRKELIGVEIKVVDAKNKANIGIKGTVVDETKNTITIETKKGLKKLIKENIMIKLKKDGLKINGNLLVGRPEERIKKKK